MLIKHVFRILLETANRDNSSKEFYKVKKRNMSFPGKENEVKRFTFFIKEITECLCANQSDTKIKKINDAGGRGENSGRNSHVRKEEMSSREKMEGPTGQRYTVTGAKRVQRGRQSGGRP